MPTIQVLPSGERFVVAITQAPLSGTDAAHWCALKVRAYQVDEHDVPLGVEIPPFTQTIPLAALADGQTTIDVQVEQVTAKATEQFRNFITAQRALASIPHG